MPRLTGIVVDVLPAPLSTLVDLPFSFGCLPLLRLSMVLTIAPAVNGVFVTPLLSIADLLPLAFAMLSNCSLFSCRDDALQWSSSGALTSLADSVRSVYVPTGCTLALLFCYRCLRSMPIQQINCFGSGTPAIVCHAKSCLNRDGCCCYRVVGRLYSPVLLALRSMPCCDRCLLTVNLFWSIAAAFGRCSCMRRLS
jgi:hypothetical protein